jgi:hypothetical protein
MKVSLVPSEYIDTCWGEVEPMLQRAVDRQDKVDIGDVLFSISNGHKSLWVAYDEEGIKGVVVSTIIQYPIKKILFLDYLGGKKGAGGTITSMTWKHAMLDILQKWAYDNNCESIEFTGRIGWLEVFKEDGCVVKSFNFELPVGSKGIKE